MINGQDLYAILTAMVPLYTAMFLAYGSVKWWKIFTPDQCSGINRFVAIFAVPLLSFHFISTNNPYTMNLRFLAADTLQKILTLLLLSLWTKFTNSPTPLEWLITIFSLSTLPNTLVIGIPLLSAMYGAFTSSLMVQVVVMQCIVWYTLLLLFFEFRAARILVREKFPDSGNDVVSIKVEADVVSLDGQDFLETATEVGDDGKLHVTVRKSNASRKSFLSGVEIYSVNSSAVQTPRGSNFNQSEFFSISGFPGGRLSNFGPATRLSNYEYDPATGCRNFSEGVNTESCLSVTKNKAISHDIMHVFPRSCSAPMTAYNKGGRVRSDLREIRMVDGDKERMKVGLDSAAEELAETVVVAEEGDGKKMPAASVMIRLILMMVWRKLIRNPNTYASIVGLIWSLVSFRWHVEMPKIIGNSISLISNTGLGMAMFSLGLFMALQPKIIACGRSKAALGMVVKFLIGPVVMALAAIIVGLRGTLLHISIVQAALSEGIVPFVFAKEYNVHPTILSTAVIFGMLITVPITLCYYIILQLL